MYIHIICTFGYVCTCCIFMHLFNVHACYCGLFLTNKGAVNGSQATEINSSTIWSKKWITPRSIFAVLILLFAFSMTYISQLYRETSPQPLKTGMLHIQWNFAGNHIRKKTYREFLNGYVCTGIGCYMWQDLGNVHSSHIWFCSFVWRSIKITRNDTKSWNFQGW